MDDSELTKRIADLVDEEHRLENTEHGPHDPDVERRVRELEIELDQAWDLLRQRRARRQAGENPDAAVERPAGTVEGYQQ
jgi:Protein of unknown function (DUF2630)